MLTFAEQIYDVAKTLSTTQANEVLNFISTLKTKAPLENSQFLAEENMIKGILKRRNQRKAISTYISGSSKTIIFYSTTPLVS